MARALALVLLLAASLAWAQYVVTFSVSSSGYIAVYISGIPPNHKVLLHWGIEPYPQGPWSNTTDTPMEWNGENYTATIGPFKNGTWVAFVFYDQTSGVWINYEGTPFWNWNVEVNPPNVGATSVRVLPNCTLLITAVGRAPDVLVLHYGLTSGPQTGLPWSNVADVAMTYNPLWGNYSALIGPFAPGQWVQWVYYDATLNEWIHAPSGGNFAAQATCYAISLSTAYPYDKYVYTDGEAANVSIGVESHTSYANATAVLKIGTMVLEKLISIAPGHNAVNFTFTVELPQGIYTPIFTIYAGSAPVFNASLPQFYVLNTTGKPPVSLVIVWNMHQPLYIEPNGSWAMPWVPLHTGEDFKWNGTYVGAYELQALLLSQFDVNASIDFTPVLLYQWEALLAEGPSGFHYLGYYPGNITYDIEAVNKTLALYKQLVEEGRVEVLTVPFYHPLQAIEYDEGWGSDLLAQLIMGEEMTKAVFGVGAACAWTPEMAFNMGLVHLYEEAGINCTVLDAAPFLPYATYINGTQDPYVPYVVQDAEGNYIYVLFRDTTLSNLFSFYLFTLSDPRLVQQLLIQYLAKVYMAHPGAVVVVALDGENPLIFNAMTGPKDLYAIYQALAEYSGSWLITQTVSQAIAAHAKYAVTNLPENSWAGNLNNWNNGYPGKTAIWRAVGLAREYLVGLTIALDKSPSPVVPLNPADAPNSTGLLDTLWNYLYIAEGSDWTWQTGPPNYGPGWFSQQPIIYVDAILDAVNSTIARVEPTAVSASGSALYVVNGLNETITLNLEAGGRCISARLEPGGNEVPIPSGASAVGVFLPVTPADVPGYVVAPSSCGLEVAQWNISALPRASASATSTSSASQLGSTAWALIAALIAAVVALAAALAAVILRRR
jgi:alpha-amylase/alpha-mannosidase (GH57 family)